MTDKSHQLESFNTRLQRMLDRLMQGLAVPFLGAGISFGARLPGERSLHPSKITFSPQTDFLIGLLARKLLSKEKHEAMSWKAIRSHLGIGPEETGNGTAEEAGGRPPSPESIVKTKKLAQLAELVDWLFGSGEACAALPMRHFVELEPCPAHRYLAYLAREGLITEMITTNYDTLLEKAFRESFGGRSHIPGIGHLESEPSVICTLQTYRGKGGLKVHGGHPPQPHLRIYKINGCADRYLEVRSNDIHHHRVDEMAFGGENLRLASAWPPPEPVQASMVYGDHLFPKTPYPRSTNHNAASEIILTERQLQHFGNRQWARDLLRDRARTSTFVFSGFGSDEPQIRHTVLALMEEFHRDVEHKITYRQGASEIARTLNAPMVTAFEPELSFSQYQILYSFYESHIHSAEHASLKQEMILEAPAHSAFTGKDRALFDPGNHAAGDALGADLFWRKIYQAAFGRLLLYHSLPGSHFYKWLEQHAILPGEQRSRLIQWLYPPARLSKDGVVSAFGRSGELLEQEGGESRKLLLWEWLWSMLFPSEIHHVEDWYLPFHLDSLFILSTLLLLRLLLFPRGAFADGEDAWRLPRDMVSARCGLGLQVRVSRRDGESEQCLYLVHESVPIPGSLFVEDQEEASVAAVAASDDGRRSRLVVQVALPSISYQESEGRWQMIIGKIASPLAREEIGVLWIGRCIRIAAGDFIREIERQDSTIKALSHLRTQIAPRRRPRWERFEVK